MGKDYYKILGVSKTADDDEIKRAYKKQALKWHPDRNAGNTEVASQKFKEISEAFEVLSDKQKRTIFDQLGEEGLKGGGVPPPGASGGSYGGGFPFASGSGFPGGTTFTFTSGGSGGGRGGFSPSDPNHIFASFFKGMSGMDGMSSMFGTSDDDMERFGGGGSSFNMFGIPGQMPRTTRRGSTRRSSFPARNSSPGPEQPSEISRPLKVSLEELYSGAVKRLKVGRKLLSGKTEDKILEITVLPGWKSGTKVRFPRAGNETSAGEAQDLVFIVEEKPHPRFVRDGSDLIATVKIPLVDALTSEGGTRQIDGLSGTKINVPVPSGVIKPGQETRVRGEGMPIRKDGAQRNKGDLVVKWEVVLPDRLTSSQKEGIRKVLL